jgi:hypothetical protein
MPPLRLGAVLKCYARGLRRFSDAVATSREGRRSPRSGRAGRRPGSGKAVEPPFQAEIVPFRLAKDLPNRNDFKAKVGARRGRTTYCVAALPQDTINRG